MGRIEKMSALIALLATGGCAGLNEGMTDIRYAAGEQWSVAGTESVGAPISRDSVVLVTLQQIYIRNFDELRIAPQRVFLGGSVLDARGQIAVLVGLPSASGPSSSVDTKDHFVVFYSNDVAEGQILNVRNQRVFGPTRITDPRFEMDFVVLELDRTSDQDAALIRSLAEWGQTVGAVGGPGIGVLTDLGEALLAPHDDVEMRFRFNFDLGDRPGAMLPMRTGLYAVIRSEHRDIRIHEGERNPDWPEVCINRDTARLHVRSPDGSCSETLFSARSYLVFNVETADLPETTIALQRFAGLTEQLRTMENPTTTAIQAVLDDAAESHARETREGQVWTALAELSNRAAAFGSLAPATCAAPEQEQSRVRARFVEQVVATHAAFDRAARGTAEGEAADRYDREVYERQAAQLARFFGEMDWAAAPGEANPTPEGRWTRAGDPAQFMATFGDVSAFRTRIEARARALWSRPCPVT